MSIIYLGADHAGFLLKEEIKNHLSEKGCKIKDLGANSLNPVDYPDYALAVARKVSDGGKKSKGILICGTGNGMCMVANRVKGIRAAVGYSLEASKKSREDNDSNILCLSGWYMDIEKARSITDVWLKTDFTKKDRHIHRINKFSIF